MSSSTAKNVSKISETDPRSPRFLCNQADFALTLGGNFRVALDQAVAHILPLNQSIKSELHKHRIILLGSGVDPADLSLTKWVGRL